MIYVVTEGQYSDYTICGVFDDFDKAEAFREYHDFDRVEDHELNPETPPYDLLRFRCVWHAKGDKVSIWRTSNDSIYDDGDSSEIQVNNYSPALVLEGYSWGRSEETAEKGWRDRIRAVKAGCVFPVLCSIETKDEVDTLDPREIPKTFSRSICKHYRYDESFDGCLALATIVAGEWE
jgi:hypothetical protein